MLGIGYVLFFRTHRFAPMQGITINQLVKIVKTVVHPGVSVKMINLIVHQGLREFDPDPGS